MGKKIEQTFAWSESRVKLLRECMWKYHLTYHIAWEGWLKNARQEKRQAYTLKNMTNFPMWVGSIVHDIIEETIQHLRKNGDFIPLEDAQSEAVQRMRRGWLDSMRKRWEHSPKNYINLEEHYYQTLQHDSETYSKSMLEKKHKVMSCVKAFYDCPLYDVMKRLKPDDWLSIEEFQKFKLNTGQEVTVKIDCGFRYGGKVYLIDWKTGRVSDSVIDQLVTYAMYALKQGWAKKPEDIIIVPVYLAFLNEMGSDAMPKLNVTMPMMKRQAEIIRQEYPILEEAHCKKDDSDFFEKTDDEYRCKRCHFRAMCSGAETEIEDGVTPF